MERIHRLAIFFITHHLIHTTMLKHILLFSILLSGFCSSSFACDYFLWTTDLVVLVDIKFDRLPDFHTNSFIQEFEIIHVFSGEAESKSIHVEVPNESIEIFYQNFFFSRTGYDIQQNFHYEPQQWILFLNQRFMNQNNSIIFLNGIIPVKKNLIPELIYRYTSAHPDPSTQISFNSFHNLYLDLYVESTRIREFQFSYPSQVMNIHTIQDNLESTENLSHLSVQQSLRTPYSSMNWTYILIGSLIWAICLGWMLNERISLSQEKSKEDFSSSMI